MLPPVYHNQWLKRLNTQLNKPTNQSLIKVAKSVKQTKKKTLKLMLLPPQCLLPPWIRGFHIINLFRLLPTSWNIIYPACKLILQTFSLNLHPCMDIIYVDIVTDSRLP